MEPTLQQIGEKRLLQVIRQHIGKSKAIIRTFSEDCAVVDRGRSKYHLFTVDLLIEGTHFHREYLPAFYIGRKALRISLSDIFAMGGTALYFLVSLGAPPETPLRMVEEIYEGMASVAKEEKVHLIGGNLSSAPVLFVDVVAIGEALKKSVLFRSGARKGDLIFVTGALGAAAEGLKLLSDGFRLLGEKDLSVFMPTQQRDSQYVRECIMAQIDPPSLSAVAKQLASWNLVHSMIDLSDGIASDLAEICRESNVGALIELSRLPVAPGVLYWERKRNLDPYRLALQGGEDYHLLFTIPSSKRKVLVENFRRSKLSLHEIGKIVGSSEGIHAVNQNGRKIQLGEGYQHFVGL